MKSIDPTMLARLRSLQAQRDRCAAAIGAAYVEFELAKARLLAESKQDMLPRMGAALVEFEAVRLREMNKVTASSARQKEVGDAALRDVGIDPNDPRTHTIDLESGRVMVLIDGRWVNEE